MRYSFEGLDTPPAHRFSFTHEIDRAGRVWPVDVDAMFTADETWITGTRCDVDITSHDYAMLEEIADDIAEDDRPDLFTPAESTVPMVRL